MGSPPSRRHVMLGAGEPEAAHLKVTELPSRTTMSVLVGESSMSGGTEKKNKQGLDYITMNTINATVSHVTMFTVSIPRLYHNMASIYIV